MEDREKSVFNYGHEGTARPVPKRRWEDTGESRRQRKPGTSTTYRSPPRRAPPPPRISDHREYGDRRQDDSHSHSYPRSQDYKRSRTDRHHSRDSPIWAEDIESRSGRNPTRQEERDSRYNRSTSSSSRPDETESRRNRDSSSRLESHEVHRRRDSSSKPHDSKYYDNRGSSNRLEDTERNKRRVSLPRDPLPRDSLQRDSLPRDSSPRDSLPQDSENTKNGVEVMTASTFNVPKPTRPLSPDLVLALSPEVIEISDSSDESNDGDKVNSDSTAISEQITEPKYVVPAQPSDMLPGNSTSEKQSLQEQKASSSAVESRAPKATKPPLSGPKMPSLASTKQFSILGKKVITQVIRTLSESKQNMANKANSVIPIPEASTDEKSVQKSSAPLLTEVKNSTSNAKYSNAEELLNVLTGKDEVSSEESATKETVISKTDLSDKLQPSASTNIASAEETTAAEREDLNSVTSGEIECPSETLSPMSDTFLECEESEPPKKRNKTKSTHEESVPLEKEAVITENSTIQTTNNSNKCSDEIPELSDAPLEKITEALVVKRPKGIKVNLNLNQDKSTKSAHNLNQNSDSSFILVDKSAVSETYIDTPRTSPELSGSSPKQLSSNGLPSPDSNDVSLYSDNIVDKFASTISGNDDSAEQGNENTKEGFGALEIDHNKDMTTCVAALNVAPETTGDFPLANKSTEVLEEVAGTKELSKSGDTATSNIEKSAEDIIVNREESDLVVVPIQVSEKTVDALSEPDPVIVSPSDKSSEALAAIHDCDERSTDANTNTSLEGADSASKETDVDAISASTVPEKRVVSLSNIETESSEMTSNKSTSDIPISPAEYINSSAATDGPANSDLTVRQEDGCQQVVTSGQQELEICDHEVQNSLKTNDSVGNCNAVTQEDNYPVLSIVEDPNTPRTQFELISDEVIEEHPLLTIRKDVFMSDIPSPNITAVDPGVMDESLPALSQEKEIRRKHIKRVAADVQSKFLVQFGNQVQKVQEEVRKMLGESLETFGDFHENLDRLLCVTEDQYRLIDGMKAKLFLLEKENSEWRTGGKEAPTPNSLDPLKLLTIDSLSEYFSSLLFIDSIANQSNYKVSSAAALNFLRHRICRILHYYCKQRPGREEGAVLASVDLLYHSFYKEFPGRDPEWTQAHIVRAWDSVRFFPGELDERAIKYDHQKVGSQGFLKKAKIMVEKVKKEIAFEDTKVAKDVQIMREVRAPQVAVPGNATSTIPISSHSAAPGRSGGFSPITPPLSAISPGNLLQKGHMGMQQVYQSSPMTTVANSQTLMQSGYVVQNADQYRVNLSLHAHHQQEHQMWGSQSHPALSQEVQNPTQYAAQSSSIQQPIQQSPQISNPVHYAASTRNAIPQPQQQQHQYMGTGNQMVNQSYLVPNPSHSVRFSRPQTHISAYGTNPVCEQRLNNPVRRHPVPVPAASAVQTSREQLREVHAQVSHQRQGTAMPQRIQSQTPNGVRLRSQLPQQQPHVVMQHPPAQGCGQHRMPQQLRHPPQAVTQSQGLVQQRTSMNQHPLNSNFTASNNVNQQLHPGYGSNQSILQSQSNHQQPAPQPVQHQPVQRSNSYPAVSYGSMSSVETVPPSAVMNISWADKGGQRKSFNMPVNNQQVPTQNVVLPTSVASSQNNIQGSS